MTVTYAHLLVVSQNEKHRADLCAPLRERQWYTVSQAADLPAALAILRRDKVDVLLVDVALATAAQNQFIHAVRQADAHHRLVILLIAPAGSEVLVREGLQAGANDWVTIPTDPALLKTRCDLAVQKITLQQQMDASVESFQEMLDRAADLRVLEKELRIGREIQAGFFPETLSTPAGWALAAHFRPAREVSGDFYDAIRLPGGRLGLVVADICGKGVGAALFMALIRTLIRAFIERDVQNGLQGLPAGEVAAQTITRAVSFTNRYILAHHFNNNLFATLFIGLLAPETGRLDYINAGHPPPLQFSPFTATVARLTRTGPAVGLVSEAVFRPQHITITPGEGLLIYTDGVTEARDPAGNHFGISRLEQMLQTTTYPIEQLLGRIDEQVTQFTQRGEPGDDITMLALGRKAETPITQGG